MDDSAIPSQFAQHVSHYRYARACAVMDREADPETAGIEAVRRPGANFVAAVQWHPEFHKSELGTLDDTPILNDFLTAARAAQTA